MKVTLINPPSPYLDNDAAYPPIGLLCIAAAMEKRHDVEIVDMTGGNEVDISELRADLFGITCVTPAFSTVKKIVGLLPADVPVVIGGPHPTFLPHDITGIGASAVVGGAEGILGEILADAAHDEMKPVYVGASIPTSVIPTPAYHLVDMAKYEKVAVYSSRGCPFNCAFCSKVWGRAYTPRPIQDVFQEVRQLVSLGFRYIVFGDDDISINPERLMDLMRLVKPLGITFRLNRDARRITERELEVCAEAGCTKISFGIESGSQRMLDAMSKRATVEHNGRAIQLVKEYGVKARAYLMVNFPGETEETVRQTIQFMRETQPDEWMLMAFVPFPGSPVFNDPEKYGINWMSDNWEDYYCVGRGGHSAPCFTTRDLTIEKQAYLHRMLREGLNET